ncbi:MAG TPA: hypothetical protein VFB52_04685 [Solirubrobacterales bacterium]|nr:hypothetical protein [Solirubrobacterales bacterium]
MISTGMCRCTCGPPITLEMDMAEEIDLNTRDLNLGEMADLFRLITDTEILVPASRMRETFTLTREKTTIGNALEEFGLVATGNKPEGDGGYADAAA